MTVESGRWGLGDQKGVNGPDMKFVVKFSDPFRAMVEKAIVEEVEGLCWLADVRLREEREGELINFNLDTESADTSAHLAEGPNPDMTLHAWGRNGQVQCKDSWTP